MKKEEELRSGKLIRSLVKILSKKKNFHVFNLAEFKTNILSSFIFYNLL